MSPKRYSPRNSAAVLLSLWLPGVTSKAPAPSATLGGSPGEPKTSCAVAGRAANAISASPIVASAACLPMLQRPTAAPLACPAPIRRGILEAIGAAASETAAFARPIVSEPFETLARQYQLLANSRLHRRMPGIGHDDEFSFRPGARQFVGAADRAYHVIAALHDDPGQMPDTADLRDEIARPRKQIMAEVMRFEPRQPERQPVLAERGDRLGVGQKRRAGALVDAPGARRRHVDARVGVDQPPVIRREQILPLVLRQKAGEGAPRFGEKCARAVE